MPLGDIAAEVLGSIFRVMGQLAQEVFFELLIKGPGCLICRLFRKEVDPDGAAVILVGMLFWVILCVAAYVAYAQLFAAAGA